MKSNDFVVLAIVVAMIVWVAPALFGFIRPASEPCEIAAGDFVFLPMKPDIISEEPGQRWVRKAMELEVLASRYHDGRAMMQGCYVILRMPNGTRSSWLPAELVDLIRTEPKGGQEP